MEDILTTNLFNNDRFLNVEKNVENLQQIINQLLERVDQLEKNKNKEDNKNEKVKF